MLIKPLYKIQESNPTKVTVVDPWGDTSTYEADGAWCGGYCRWLARTRLARKIVYVEKNQHGPLNKDGNRYSLRCADGRDDYCRGEYYE